MISVILLLVVCFVAYANGANDNFKGVATLFGSGTARYRTALGWASAATFAGAIVSTSFSQSLVRRFSGQDLLPAELAGSPEFLFSVGFGAALTVILATVYGFPISTTHSLTGALLGAGFMAVGSGLQFMVLAQSFFAPLALSPLLAVVLCWILYQPADKLTSRVNSSDEVCVCVEKFDTSDVPAVTQPGVLCLKHTGMPLPTYGTRSGCEWRGARRIFGIRAAQILDYSHFASAGLVSFARGLNDTPKIAALLAFVDGIQTESAFLAVALAMLLGGLLNARKVAETMSRKITSLSHGDGFRANVVTAFLVIAASRFGLPVSTTHTSVGSLFGAGVANGRANNRMVAGIGLSWILTLPVASLISAGTYFLCALYT